MSTCLAALVLFATAPAQVKGAFYAVPVDELELAAGQVLPSYAGSAPWEGWNAGVESLPWAVLDGEDDGENDDGPGDVVLQLEPPPGGRAGEGELQHPLGVLCARTSEARELAGTLFLPKASGEGFLRLAFRVPAARATASETDFRTAELQRVLRLMRLRLPGGAWFRHRHDELKAALGSQAPPAPDPEAWLPWRDFREPADALELFSGGRALYENLQLERGLPASAAGQATVALDSLPGITVRAFDWKPLLAAGETALDPLAGLIPADQHAVFFPSFQAFADVLDEAERLGEFGLAAFERRSADAGTLRRLERQLCLELDGFARALGPLAIESVALTGSDPYLRSGSDVALLFRTKDAHALQAFLAQRQDVAAPEVEAEYGGMGVGTSRSHPPTHSRAGGGFRAVVGPTRSISSYVCTVRDVVVVTNSRLQFERIVEAGGGKTPALEAQDEYRYFRQRYPLGAVGESALLVMPDAAIRRWCSPRWRIGAARRMHAAASLAELHAAHAAELLEGVERELGTDPRFPALGALRLTADGVHSSTHGTLDFLTPIAELPLEQVTEQEAALYRTWREGYERAWSNFFDPIGACLSVAERRTALDLTVLPLLLGTEYAELREVTRGAELEAGSGDAHAEALVHFVLGLDPEWEPLKSIGSTLGSAGAKLGVDPLGWLGGWVAVYADAGAFWDELVQATDTQEVLEGLQSDPNEVPLAVVIAVRNPLQLALFLTGLRAFVDGTAPGMTDWKERVVLHGGVERRFVEISSPGLGQEFSLFYATTPSAWILSLHEPTLLAAVAREESRRTGGSSPAAPWAGAHAGLDLGSGGLQILEAWFGSEVAASLRRDCWRNLPILNEWKRLQPELDPVVLHERVFRERLECPGGGSYSWNTDWRTMESSVFGHPGVPKPGIRRPRAWDDLAAARFALTFEHDGLRARAEIERE